MRTIYKLLFSSVERDVDVLIILAILAPVIVTFPFEVIILVSRFSLPT
jgi:hypothetical protein